MSSTINQVKFTCVRLMLVGSRDIHVVQSPLFLFFHRVQCLYLDIIYGPLSNRATSVIFEGIPTYPNVSRYWNVIDKHQVNIFYTVPTAIRSLMVHDDTYVTESSRQSLKVLGTVGEPINPEAWKWYHSVVGKKCFLRLNRLFLIFSLT